MARLRMKWSREKLEFLKECIEHDLSPTQMADLFYETYPEGLEPWIAKKDSRGRTSLHKSVENMRTRMVNCIDFDNLVEVTLSEKPVRCPVWTQEEEDIVRSHVPVDTHSKAYFNPGDSIYKAITKEIYDLTGFIRTYNNIKAKVSMLRAENKVTASRPKTKYKIHETLTVLEDVDKGTYYDYKVKCNKGHITFKKASSLNTRCSVCKASWVGNLPDLDDPTPSVVYLIYTEEAKAIKIGYASGEGESAIINRFSVNPIPYAYKILAYTQGKAGIIARKEQRLLKQTEEYKRFLQSPNFGGWTEFRHQHILKDILPEFETVLDNTLDICYNIYNKKDLEENYG